MLSGHQSRSTVDPSPILHWSPHNSIAKRATESSRNWRTYSCIPILNSFMSITILR